MLYYLVQSWVITIQTKQRKYHHRRPELSSLRKRVRLLHSILAGDVVDHCSGKPTDARYRYKKLSLEQRDHRSPVSAYDDVQDEGGLFSLVNMHYMLEDTGAFQEELDSSRHEERHAREWSLQQEIPDRSPRSRRA